MVCPLPYSAFCSDVAATASLPHCSLSLALDLVIVTGSECPFDPVTLNQTKNSVQRLHEVISRIC
jgi:hypothetical protein